MTPAQRRVMAARGARASATLNPMVGAPELRRGAFRDLVARLDEAWGRVAPAYGEQGLAQALRLHWDLRDLARADGRDGAALRDSRFVRLAVGQARALRARRKGDAPAARDRLVATLHVRLGLPVDWIAETARLPAKTIDTWVENGRGTP